MLTGETGAIVLFAVVVAWLVGLMIISVTVLARRRQAYAEPCSRSGSETEGPCFARICRWVGSAAWVVGLFSLI